MAGLADAGDQWAPNLNLGVPVLIPEAYVPDLDLRLGLYRRLSSLATQVELEGFAAELIDRFGPLPREVNTLLLVVRIKAMCRRAGIARLDAGPKGATVQFHQDRFANPAGLVDYIKGHPDARVAGNKVVLLADWKTEGSAHQGRLRGREGPGREARGGAGLRRLSRVPCARFGTGSARVAVPRCARRSRGDPARSVPSRQDVARQAPRPGQACPGGSR